MTKRKMTAQEWLESLKNRDYSQFNIIFIDRFDKDGKRVGGREQIENEKEPKDD